MSSFGTGQQSEPKIFSLVANAILDRTCMTCCAVPADGAGNNKLFAPRRLSSVTRHAEPLKDKPKKNFLSLREKLLKTL
jgi:hypothetical protein